MATEASEQANRSGMDPLRLVVIFYLVAGLVLAFFFDRLVEGLFVRLAVSNPTLIDGPDWKVSTVISLLLSVGLLGFAYFHPRSRALSMEIASELMKVTWPSWNETKVSTIAVVVASLLAAVLLFAIDSVAYKLMVDWLPTLWGSVNGR